MTAPPSGPGETPLLRVEGVSKDFGPVRALADVELAVMAGECHALVGHNGSGKSTLIKILSGFHRADPGARSWLDGEPVPIGALAGRSEALSFVHQDLGLIMELSAVENLALRGGFACGRFGRVRWSEQERQTRRLMAPFGTTFDLNAPVAVLTPVERAVVAIAAALQGWSDTRGVLVLDEPTALLPHHEVDLLHQILRDLRERGAGILYVTHRLDDALDEADRVTVFRSGRRVVTRPTEGLSKRALVDLMLGTEAGARGPAALPAGSGTAPALRAEDLAGGDVDGIDLVIGEGEVVGIAGLAGSGASDVPRLLTDRRHEATGTMTLGAQWSGAVSGYRGHGLSLVPPDRLAEGVIAAMSVAENLSMSVWDRLQPRGWLSSAIEARFTESYKDGLDLRADDTSLSILTLSGGNQQKVLIGRALAAEPVVLVLCEPTAGVDVGARAGIRRLILDRAASGLGVLVVSSDLEDLTEVCSRIVVMREGRIATELTGDERAEKAIVAAMEGVLERKPR